MKRWGWLTVLATGGLAAPAALADCVPAGELTVGVARTASISETGCDAWRLESSVPLRIELLEGEGDFSLVAGAGEHERVHECGAGEGWMETLRLPAGSHRLLVRRKGGADTARRYELVLDELAGPVDEALALTANACAAAAGAKASAADAMHAAAAAWEAAGSAREATWLTLAAGLKHRDLGMDLDAALAAFERAAASLPVDETSDWPLRIVVPQAQALAWAGRGSEAEALVSNALSVTGPGTDPALVAHLLISRGLAFQLRDDLDPAVADYEAAAGILARHPHGTLGATVHNNLAGVHHVRGEPAPALAEYEQALVLIRQAGDDSLEATTYDNLGSLYASIGAFDDALVNFSMALERFERLGLEADVAATLRGIGSAYLGLGHLQRAQALLEASIERVPPDADWVGAQAAWLLLGDVRRELGDLDGARAAHERALAAAESSGQALAAGRARAALGRDALATGRPEEAIGLIEAAIAVFAPGSYRRELAEARYALGLALAALGETARATRALDDAARLQRELGDDRALSLTLTRQARLADEAGADAEALALAEAAVAALERARTRIANADLRAGFFGSRIAPYDELVRLHLAEGGESGALAALAASERARARALKELASSGDGHGSDGAYGAEASRLVTRMNGQLMRLRALQDSLDAARRAGDPAAARQALSAVRESERTLARLRIELDALDARLLYGRDGTPRVSTRVDDLREVQRRLPDDRAVLAWHLGADQAWAWLMRHDGVRAYSLGPTADLEAAARQGFELASRWQQDPSELSRSLRALSRRLLPEGDWHRGVRRLVLVPDGALHLVPFAALSLADHPGALAERLEISIAPALAFALPAEQAGPTLDARPVAVFADPLYGDDIPFTGTTDSSPPSLGALLHGLAPLPWSGLEAERILGAAQPEQVRVFRGADASKARLAASGLGGYGVVHFATHAIASTEYPELSGLVLSQIDAQGRSVDGLLHLQEVYGLTVDAELVVLSACRTAVGRRLRGEGPLSLGRAFLFAGADRVLVTQWRVPDDVTAQLMTVFYEGLFRRRLAPAAALRDAQLTVRAGEDTSQPFYWAGFALAGRASN